MFPASHEMWLNGIPENPRIKGSQKTPFSQLDNEFHRCRLSITVLSGVKWWHFGNGPFAFGALRKPGGSKRASGDWLAFTETTRYLGAGLGQNIACKIPIHNGEYLIGKGLLSTETCNAEDKETLYKKMNAARKSPLEDGIAK